MPRVLIPSDNPDFVRYLANAYAQAGWDAAVGLANFDLMAAQYERVHLQWPEELSSWHPPCQKRLGEIATRLDSWKSRGAELVLTVHNLRPHRNSRDPMYKRLQDAVYERVSAMFHFTTTSRELVEREFPSSAKARHLVTGYFSHRHLVPEHRAPAAARQKWGFHEDEFVVLIFGGLREWSEVELVRGGFDRARIPRKRLLVCGRYDEPGPIWLQRWRRWKWAGWLRARRAVVISGYIPDEAVHTVLDSADAVIIPRYSALNSGVPGLAASFGKIIVAPDCGAYPELLAGTDNPIFIPGNSEDLARKLERAAQLDRKVVAGQNLALTEKWSWANLIGPFPAALPHRD